MTPAQTLTDDTSTVSTADVATLRRLSGARAGFALAWAALLALSASSLTALSVALLLVYPLVDLAAAAYDARTSGASGPRVALRVNLGLSLVAAIALAAAATSGIPAVLRVWGVWAVATGVVQLVAALQRRGLGGQWPLVLSGAISTLAGASFVVSASGTDPELTALSGYAALGGVFFLVSALRLWRPAATS